MIRTFRDGHHETWWAVEVEAGPYGSERARRALVVTTDPERLPRLGTWYLSTNLPHPDSDRETSGEPAPASVAEIVRLYGLRMWVEQSYKQVKHALGWSDYQVRSDLAICRHWQLVCCAFSFCWWACGSEGLDLGDPPRGVLESDGERPPETSRTTEAGGKRSGRPPLPSWPRALRRVRAWLEPYVMLTRYWRAFTDKDPPEELRVLLERLFSGEGIYLYVH